MFSGSSLEQLETGICKVKEQVSQILTGRTSGAVKSLHSFLYQKYKHGRCPGKESNEKDQMFIMHFVERELDGWQNRGWKTTSISIGLKSHGRAMVWDKPGKNSLSTTSPVMHQAVGPPTLCSQTTLFMLYCNYWLMCVSPLKILRGNCQVSFIFNISSTLLAKRRHITNVSRIKHLRCVYSVVRCDGRTRLLPNHALYKARVTNGTIQTKSHAVCFLRKKRHTDLVKAIQIPWHRLGYTC